MDEMDLYTVNVFQSQSGQAEHEENTDEADPDAKNDSQAKPISKFQNMVSARVIKGRTLELEHSNLAGPEVKFKTVINYERTLEPKSLLGITFSPQEGYITRSDEG